jgi:hypothetical protein
VDNDKRIRTKRHIEVKKDKKELKKGKNIKNLVKSVISKNMKKRCHGK